MPENDIAEKLREMIQSNPIECNTISIGVDVLVAKGVSKEMVVAYLTFIGAVKTDGFYDKKG